jgi:hypothetical protein
MKHIKKFEAFDLGRFSEEEEFGVTGAKPEEIEECEPCASEYEEEEEDYSEEEESEEEHEMRRKVWGDEATVERVSSFSNFLNEKKAKPDFLDLDKDNNKKESMKKAAKDAKEDKKDNKKEDKKEDKKEEKGGKGLTAAQKKLPEGLRKAIEAKKKK